MPTRYYKNAPSHTIPGGVANGSTTSIVVDSVTGWPTQYPFAVIIEPDTALEEICDVTNITGTTLTVTRGVDGSTASAHAAGSVIAHGVIARDMTEANSHVNATTGVHGGTGSPVDTGSVQTITANKTFSGTVALNGTTTATAQTNLQGNVNATAAVFIGGAGTNIGAAWTTYTPTWTASTNPAIGNGTLTGAYQQIGKIIIYRINIVAGSTTTFGTGAYFFGLPVAAAVINSPGGGMSIFDTSAGSHRQRLVLINAATTCAAQDDAGAFVTGAVPFALANGDTIRITGVYEAA